MRILIFLLFAFKVSFGQGRGIDSTSKMQKVALTATEKIANPKVVNESSVSQHVHELTEMEWLLVFLPILLFLFLFYYFMNWLKSENYSLSSALSSDTAVTIAEVSKTATDTATGAAPLIQRQVNETTQDIFPKSASRIIAFLAAMASITLALIAFPVEIYVALNGSAKALNIEGLYDLVLSLGIGILPYGVNKITTAFKQKAS